MLIKLYCEYNLKQYEDKDITGIIIYDSNTTCPMGHVVSVKDHVCTCEIDSKYMIYVKRYSDDKNNYTLLPSGCKDKYANKFYINKLFFTPL